MSAAIEPGSEWWPVRHWRGELSLAKSYWLSAIGLGVATSALGAAEQLVPAGLRWGAASGLLLLTFATAGAIWQGMGNWRAAGRSIRRRRVAGRWSFWAYLVRVLVVLGFMALTLQGALLIIPAAWDQVRLIAGYDRFDSHVVTMRENGREVEVIGLIGLGTTDDVRRALAAAPAASTVALTSLGGRVNEARALADLIRARGLSTYVPRFCASACTLVFQAGTRRWLGQGAKLGYHHYFAGSLFGRVIPVEDMRARSDFAALDVPAWFVSRVFNTPPASIWVPDQQTLLDVHIVTDTTDGTPPL